jgi:hypothetical protein
VIRGIIAANAEDDTVCLRGEFRELKADVGDRGPVTREPFDRPAGA